MHFKIYFILYVILVSCNFSLYWSSQINSLFRSRSMFPVTSGLNPVLMESMATGAQMAVEHCRNVFKWDKWNCPQSAFSRQAKQLATREQAYSEAIIAAGIVYSITENCSKGEIIGCACNLNTKGNFSVNFTMNQINTLNLERIQQKKETVTDWTWGGCSDDTIFAENMVSNYLETPKEQSDLQAYVNRHNNRVGRELIRRTMVRKCRCHGVSGSCALQTCWMQMAPFKKVAHKLRESYYNAVKLSFDYRKGSVPVGNSVRSMLEFENKDIFSNNLIYLEDSPNYCLPNSTNGWMGTLGRSCSRAETTNLVEKQSCRSLCRSCGHKIRKHKRQISSRCNCKFIWCCEVKCDICKEIVEEHFCE